jgi:hypothetical protein
LTVRSGAGFGFDSGGVGFAECWTAEKRPVDWFERYGVAVATMLPPVSDLTSAADPPALNQG